MSQVTDAIARAKILAKGGPVTEAILNEALSAVITETPAQVVIPASVPVPTAAPSLAQKIETAVETALGIEKK